MSDRAPVSVRDGEYVEIERAEYAFLNAEIERLRLIVRQNLPMVEAHIDRHPDVAKRMCRTILEWVDG